MVQLLLVFLFQRTGASKQVLLIVGEVEVIIRHLFSCRVALAGVHQHAALQGQHLSLLLHGKGLALLCLRNVNLDACRSPFLVQAATGAGEGREHPRRHRAQPILPHWVIVLRHRVGLILGLFVAAALRYYCGTVAPVGVSGVLVLGMALVLAHYEVEVSIVETLVCDAAESACCFLDGLASPSTALLSHREAHALVSLDGALFRQPDRVLIRDHSVALRLWGLLQEYSGPSVPHLGLLTCSQVRAGAATQQQL